MPNLIIIKCYKCERGRKASQLTTTHITSLGDGTEMDHYKYVCKNGCIPTTWEKWRETRQHNKAAREVQAWVKSKENKS